MLRSDEFYVQQVINEGGGMPEIQESMDSIKKYLTCCYYKSKDIRLDEWRPDDGELYELVLGVFTYVLQNPKGTTYQAIAGITSGRFPHENTVDRVKTAAECIALIARTDMIRIERSGSGSYIMIKSKYALDHALPEPDKHQVLMEKPPEFTSNNPPGFGKLILGGRYNYHEGNICLDHINRMNAIPLRLNNKLLRIYEEAPSFLFKTQEQKEQWEKFVSTSYRSYIQTVKNGNRFYLNHRPDKRGRTYADGYHITTQGSAFKKAIVQLYATEIVKIERSK